jgi:HEPN superfamily protein
MMDWSAILEEDLRWREAELASLKRIAITNTDNEVILRATLRASWAILYAHFEGFTKFCWELLLDQIQRGDIVIEELSENFLLLALEKRFRQLRGNVSSVSLWKFFNAELPNTLREKAFFATDCRLETESNLWPKVFERECARIGIYSTMLQSSRSRIRALVSRRNDIAHGKNMTIKSVEEYTEYETTTLLVLHDLAVQVLDILEKETYKKANIGMQATAASVRSAPAASRA